MRTVKPFAAAAVSCLAISSFAQAPGGPTPKQMATHEFTENNAYVPPKPSKTIPSGGIHLVSEIGSFKIKRGADFKNLGTLQISFRGTVLVSGLDGKITASNGAFLAYPQPQFKKLVYFSKSVGTLNFTGRFDGVQFFGQKVNAYYRGDGVIQLFGEFDKNLNTGTYWYDAKPTEKNYWGTSGMTLTPQPYQAPAPPPIKIKTVTGKG